MTEDQAMELLQLHAMIHESTDHPKMEHGFLGMLKYYQGDFKEENFHEVMEAIRCLANRIQTDAVDRIIVGSIYGICFCTWNWALKPDGLLRRNHEIPQKNLATLSSWIDCIYWTTTLLLNGAEHEDAFAEYTPFQQNSTLLAS